MSRSVYRIFICTKDVQAITGRSRRTAQRLLKQVREHYGKNTYSMISVIDFCNYTGLNVNEVKECLRS